MLLRRILKAPISTPKEALYLELGILPIGVLIKSKRIKYLHYILKRDKKEMIYQFFMAQWLKPSRGDWTETVKQDLLDFGMPIDFNYLKSKGKYSIKNELKKTAKDYAFSMLIQQKETHRKMNYLEYNDLKTQNYCYMEGLKVHEIQNIFKYRTKMTKVSGNYKGKEGVSQCPLCGLHPDVQEKMTTCETIKDKMDINVDISNIFSENITYEVARAVSKMQEIREKLMEAK